MEIEHEHALNDRFAQVYAESEGIHLQVFKWRLADSEEEAVINYLEGRAKHEAT